MAEHSESSPNIGPTPPGGLVLTHLDPASVLAVGLLIFTLAMVMMFEATNGFHDAANAVATVIYTKSLQPAPAVVWSAGENAPVWWMRGILVFTCSAVSFAHGTNDGQKSIGMIMLAVIGLFPAAYALNPAAGQALNQLPQAMEQAQPAHREIRRRSEVFGTAGRENSSHTAQGAAAEVVSAAVIGVSGFTGLPVSTTHIVISGIGGTMVTAGAGLQYGVISRILMAWLFTLPVTMLISAGIYYLLADPRF